jgi:segregation and condensation protein B
MDSKRLIEAILFVAGREVTTEELMRATGIVAPGFIERIVSTLAEEYQQRGSAIEIKTFGNAHLMRIKQEFVDKVQGFFKESELNKIALRSLAFIAKNEGVAKSDVVKALGSSAYQGIKELISKGFVKAVKAGRTKKLFLTKKFKMYFEGFEK